MEASEIKPYIFSAQKRYGWTSGQTLQTLYTFLSLPGPELIDIWKTIPAQLKSFIEDYPMEHYTNAISVKKPNEELSTIEFRKTFPHMINHSTYHRGQLVTLLRQSRFSNLSNTDLFTYYNN